MSIVGTPDFPDRPTGNPGWLTDSELSWVRSRMPIVYVEALPVRVDQYGAVTEVGLLLRASETGVITRTIVSGRVRHTESLREALLRHLENDLGPMAFPQLPVSPVPDSVAEYFPVPDGDREFSDERQHAVSLAYVVPVTGSCQPRQDALELTWMTPEQARSPEIAADMIGNRGLLVARLLAAVNC
ncbi:MAG: NUDIX hydrolase family protein [Microbacteriaceae bacterium]|jgi:ADP-ribose pyrophosphatase YjhB (NUDIX family)|nr:NUDIX hydrolase family protein [Microbacteriaceae bacterium]MCI1206944.1 NUDIX hydrolase family protein [Microbacteriaceae bacterium]